MLADIELGNIGPLVHGYTPDVQHGSAEELHICLGKRNNIQHTAADLKMSHHQSVHVCC